MCEGGWFGGRDQISSPVGLIAVGPAGNHWRVVVGGQRLRGRGQLKGWGSWSLGYMRGGRSGAQNQKSMRLGLILVEPVGKHWITLVGGWKLQ
jgi:hypothetical protein